MHLCFREEKIVRHIALHLVGAKQKASAVALACCCKSFEDPALDALWATEASFDNLQGVLPREVWTCTYMLVSMVTITSALSPLTNLIRKKLARLPTVQEWARFRKYAGRMRNILSFTEIGRAHV